MLAGAITTGDVKYNIGGIPHKPNVSNPKGFFETREVNNINDCMLFNDKRSTFTDGSRHGWLTRFPENETPETLPDTQRRISAVTNSKPFCIKDPRLSYTLPIWQGSTPPAKIIVVFRHPGAVVNSIMENCRTTPSLSKIQIDRETCYKIWACMYLHILRHARDSWFFVHYTQMVGETETLDRIEEMLNTEMNRNFPTRELQRSTSTNDIPDGVTELYEVLRQKAGYFKGA
jgi:hypothetical protein